MRSLIERQGAVATVVPSMREVPLDPIQRSSPSPNRCLRGRVDVVVFLTGVGARMLLEVAETRFDREALLDALRRVTVAVRGPKPVAVLREWNVPIAIRAAEPNTWRELVTALAAAGAIAGKRIAIQEYGRPNTELYDELRRRGSRVEPVPVYRWTLPEDTAPLQAAVAGDDRQDDSTFCSSPVRINSTACSKWPKRPVKKRRGSRRPASCVIASIGPTASEALRDSGLPVDVEAQPTRMGHLVRAALEAAPAILAAKAR